MKGVFINLTEDGSRILCALKIVDLDNGIECAAYESAGAEQVVAELLELFSEQQIIVGEALFICYNPVIQKSLFDRVIELGKQQAAQLPLLWLDLAGMFWAQFQRNHRDGHMPAYYGLGLDEIAQALGLNRSRGHSQPLGGVEMLVDCYRLIVGWPNPAETHHGAI